MQTLRHAHTLAKFILVWFALSIGVAIASPLVKPQAIDLVCVGGGGIKLLVKSDDGKASPQTHTLDCPLCASLSAPPPVVQQHVDSAQPLAYALRSIPSARIAERTAAPLPARGPPAFFL